MNPDPLAKGRQFGRGTPPGRSGKAAAPRPGPSGQPPTGSATLCAENAAATPTVTVPPAGDPFVMRLALAALVLAGVADAVTTWAGLQVPHAHEANPLLRAVMNGFGMPTALLARVVVGVLAAAALRSVARHAPRLRAPALAIAFGGAALWWVAAANNAAVIAASRFG